MAYKKYIKKEGKVYGPYSYKSIKKKGRVTTEYLGKGDETKVKTFFRKNFPFMFLFLILVLAIFIIGQSFTGKVIGNFEHDYTEGEKIIGNLNLKLEEGEFIPANSKVLVNNSGDIIEYELSNLIGQEILQGNFYIKESNISGFGKGYGYGNESSKVSFVLDIFSEKNETKEKESKENLVIELNQSSKNESEKKIVENGSIGNGSIKEIEVNDEESNKNKTGEVTENLENESGETEESLSEDESVEGDSEKVDSSEDNPMESSEIESESSSLESSSEDDSSEISSDSKSENSDESSDSGSSSEVSDSEDSSSDSGDSGSSSSSSDSSGSDSSSDSGENSGSSSSDSSVGSKSRGNSGNDGSDSGGGKSESTSGGKSITGNIVKGFTKFVSNLFLGITGHVTLELEDQIEGVVSRDKSFSYKLGKDQTAEINFSEEDIDLEFQGNKVIVTTDYVEDELNINLSELGLKAKEGNLDIKIIYDNETLVEDIEKISVSENQTKVLENSTLEGETQRHQIVIGRPVKWVQKVEINKSKDLKNAKVKIPKYAKGVAKVKKGKEAEDSIKEIEEFKEKLKDKDVKKKMKERGKNKTKSEINEETIEEYEKEIKEIVKNKSKNSKGKSFGITGHASLEIDLDKKGFFERIFEKSFGRFLTGHSISDSGDSDSNEMLVDISEAINGSSENESVVVEYYTDAPEFFEENISKGKRVTISASDELNYTEVLAYTEISEIFEVGEENLIKVIWKNENKEVDFDAYDLDDDGYLDYVEWIAPHLSEQTFEIILITDAQHLDSNKDFISNIYNEVFELDDVWSEEISSDEYVRITFEKNLSSENDITVYPRIVSGNPKIEVYEENKTELITEFLNLEENKYNKVYLNNLIEIQDTFDLKILNGSLEFDHIIDPSAYYDPVLDIQTGWDCTGTDCSLGHYAVLDEGYRQNNIPNISDYIYSRANEPKNEEHKINSISESNVSSLNLWAYIETGSNYEMEIILNNDGSEVESKTISPGTSKSWVSLNWTNVSNIGDISVEFSSSKSGGGSPKNGYVYSWYIEVNYLEVDNPPQVNLISPSNESVDTDTNVNFKCNFSDDLNLSNVTFYWDYPNSWGANETVEVSGTYGETIFQKTNVEDTSLKWNCYVCDNSSQCSFAGENNTLFISDIWETPESVESYCGEENNFEANNTIDEDIGTFWRHNEAERHNITYDLGEFYSINAIRYYDDSNSKSLCGVDLWISEDLDFSSDEKAFENWNVTPSNQGWQEKYFSSFDGRYIKMNFKINGDTGCQIANLPNGVFSEFQFNASGVNYPPEINYVSNLSEINPTEASYTDVEFNVYMYDAGGVSDLNDSSVNASFSKAGEITRFNSSCVHVNDIDANTANYSCSIKMWYFDAPGIWNVSVYGKDNQGEIAVKDSTNFTYNQLKAIVISSSNLNFGNIATGAINQTASNNLVINNTGNYNGSIEVTAYDLYGDTDDSKKIPAENFTIGLSSGLSSCGGTQLINNTDVNIVGSVLASGNLSSGGGAGQEELYCCIPKVPIIPSQIYSTSDNWIIKI